eukprot:CAMPEP_0202914978 /NCGR_PEP_ID=MMETSP1392-20130828/64574_1 /ASSEMBLY_ACC=CAM_ASM_000868 /TAXON_ID=225041 /ORGANISM="Chlamydomonas chlamydogama, Strain SAG 11-48b" /LENGTH=100 /DNA_ID=CAMNT_0049606847 /DNA_START=981 /DNA_END=1284 /DNA_ORIENTATION=+
MLQSSSADGPSWALCHGMQAPHSLASVAAVTSELGALQPPPAAAHIVLGALQHSQQLRPACLLILNPERTAQAAVQHHALAMLQLRQGPDDCQQLLLLRM